jgi:hypothetical protein
MTLYGIARIVKFFAVLTYAGALIAGFTSPSALQRKWAVHAVASPALLAIWGAGAALAWLRGSSLGELWVVGGFSLSLVSSAVLSYSVARDVRTGRVFAGCVLPLGLAIVMMVLRPKWSTW